MKAALPDREIVVSSWTELLDALYIDSYNDYLKRHRSSYVYRGLEKSPFTLSTALNRLGESRLEKHLLRNFKKYAQLPESYAAKNFDSIWNLMAIAQHHGLPTRYLDWTYSPLVALHFAVADFTLFDENGAIHALNYVDTKQYLPAELERIIDQEGSHIFTPEMLDRVVKDLPALGLLKAEAFAVFVEPPSLDQRIVNQYAVFSMMSNPSVVLDSWLQGKEIRYFKIIIPAALKWEIRDKLDQANINERVLFPGLDGLARWLKRHYWDLRRNQKLPDDEELGDFFDMR